MLAVVLSNGAVQLFQPPVQALEFEWVSVASPSNVLLQHLQRVDFDISRPAVRHIPCTHQHELCLPHFPAARPLGQPSHHFIRVLLVSDLCYLTSCLSFSGGGGGVSHEGQAGAGQWTIEAR